MQKVRPNFEQFEAESDLLLTIFCSKSDCLRPETKNFKFNYTNHISTKEMDKIIIF